MNPSAGRGRSAARLVALGIVTALLVVAARRLSVARVLAELATANPLWIVLALLSFAAILPLWALQWRLLAPDTRVSGAHDAQRAPGVQRAPGAHAAVPPPFSAMLGVVAMTSTVLNTTPMLVGEAAGVFFLVADAGLGRAAAVSVLAMDQLIVGIAKLCVLAVVAVTVDLPVWMARGAAALVGAVGALLVLVVIVAWQAPRLASVVERKRPAPLARRLVAVGAALAPVRSPSRSTGALALALAKKGAEALAILCVSRAFGVDLAFGNALLVLAAVNLATLLPVVPGNIGVYEAATVLAYGYLGVGAERALGIAVVQHACWFVALALPGYRWLARIPAARSSAAAA